MPVHRLSDMTWEEVRDADRINAVAILPVGAVEAHGPHLPLGTDVIIAEAMATSGAEKLANGGHTVLILPPLWYTAAAFAKAFPGTIGGPLTQDTFTFNPELPSYNLLNLRVGVKTEKWDIALFVNNVTDEIAFLALDQERGSRARVGYLTNQPRTAGISARVNL